MLILSNGSFLVDNTYTGSPSYTNALDCTRRSSHCRYSIPKSGSLEIVKIFDQLKQFNKFCIVGKQWPSEIME